MAALRPAAKLAAVLRVSCPTKEFARRPLGLLILADHGCSAIYIEASVTAPLALSRAADLANGLECPCVHAAASVPLFPSAGDQTEAANPAAKNAPEPRNQTIECSAPCLPANGNR
jgi:hypothetical protein